MVYKETITKKIVVGLLLTIIMLVPALGESKYGDKDFKDFQEKVFNHNLVMKLASEGYYFKCENNVWRTYTRKQDQTRIHIRFNRSHSHVHCRVIGDASYMLFLGQKFQKYNKIPINDTEKMQEWYIKAVEEVVAELDALSDHRDHWDHFWWVALYVYALILTPVLTLILVMACPYRHSVRR